MMPSGGLTRRAVRGSGRFYRFAATVALPVIDRTEK